MPALKRVHFIGIRLPLFWLIVIAGAAILVYMVVWSFGNEINSRIVVGALTLALGGLISTYGFNDQARGYPELSRTLGWATILAGVVFVTLGGLLSTWGWNQLNDAQKKRLLLHAVAAEVGTNMNVLTLPEFTSKGDQFFSKFIFYPRFERSALATVLPSGLFLDDDDDKTLLTIVLETGRRIDDLNRRMILIEERIINGAKSLEERKRIRDSPAFVSLTKWIVALGKHLIDHYKLDPNKSFYVDGKQIVK